MSYLKKEHHPFTVVFLACMYIFNDLYYYKILLRLVQHKVVGKSWEGGLLIFTSKPKRATQRHTNTHNQQLIKAFGQLQETGAERRRHFPNSKKALLRCFRSTL